MKCLILLGRDETARVRLVRMVSDEELPSTSHEFVTFELHVLNNNLKTN